MAQLIAPDQIPQWIPGDLTIDSAGLGWRDLTLKGYRYAEQEVQIPAMRDYMIVVYRGADRALMRRRAGGAWHSATVGCGVATLLTRAEQSTWHWTSPIDVRHIYVGHATLEAVAADAFEQPLASLEIEDQVGRPDPVLATLQGELELELLGRGCGSGLYVEALRTQIAIHLLRTYARCEFRSGAEPGLGPRRRRHLEEYVTIHLHDHITLERLAGVAGLSPYHFARKFKSEFGEPPHSYVIARRVSAACQLLRATHLPLKAIASDCGFADQSHFSRLFQRRMGVTPGEYRRQVTV